MFQHVMYGYPGDVHYTTQCQDVRTALGFVMQPGNNDGSGLSAIQLNQMWLHTSQACTSTPGSGLHSSASHCWLPTLL